VPLYSFEDMSSTVHPSASVEATAALTGDLTFEAGTLGEA
jgi:hypothetical protein